ncbi:uroporphyrinogen-III synthase [Calidifontibacillus oryziterrae]|uniref:uroporphyrinogen-III synthase n=1 Tax=Calidifontibacillus oryziterrae TaxID=1191699 RepID=UPI0002FA7E63|nr:uroporphyrinogen-III synthase [Calidifontibacillus oryziterrae]
MSKGGSLEGKRILVTRAKEQAKSFSGKIKELGGIPIEIPLIKFESIRNDENIKHYIDKIDSYDWLVFTSVNGVRFFFEYLDKNNNTFTSTNRPQIAVVGKKTLQPLQQRGIKVDLIPEEYVAEGLIEAMSNKVLPNSRILIARGNLGRSILPEKLTELGMIVDDWIVYETVIDYDKKSELLELLLTRSIDMITFTSSSTVTYFVDLLANSEWRDFLKGVQIACIGPITERTAIEAGICPDVVAMDYTIEGLIDAIVKFYNSQYHDRVNL